MTVIDVADVGETSTRIWCSSVGRVWRKRREYREMARMILKCSPKMTKAVLGELDAADRKKRLVGLKYAKL